MCGLRPQIISAALRSQDQLSTIREDYLRRVLGKEHYLMQSTLQDPRPTLLSIIDKEACSVEFSGIPIVLLCGGFVEIKDRHDDPDPPIRSLRHAVIHSDTSYETFIPENIKSWQSDGVFKNLMSFEEDLASICSLVVVILESYGSLAELGAFFQHPDLSHKILVIKSSDFQNQTSFIDLGILRHIEAIAENDNSIISSVKNYPWNIKDPTSISAEVVDDVITDIQEELNRLPRRPTLNLSNKSHVIVFMCEIIELFSALKEHEIREYLDLVGVTITKEELKRKLFLLEKFRLIKKEGYSDASFYMRSKEKHHRLRLALREGSNKDALRIKMECIEYYNKDPKQRNRIRTIAQALKVVSK